VAFKRLVLLAGLAGVLAPVVAQTALPAEVETALARARLPRDAITLLVLDAQGSEGVRLSHRAQEPVNPASVMKLVTTFAALDLLGPAFTWNTPVYLDGPVVDGSLRGNLVIKGQGDPKLVVERLWLLLRRVQAQGVRAIEGDIVLDRSAFELAPADPAQFDGEPLRPYNAAPDALLINFKSVVLSFTPDQAGTHAQVGIEPLLAGLQWPASVPIQAGECGDYRAALKPDFSDPNRIRLNGVYPSGCAEKRWPVAYIDPASFAARAIEAQWRAMGGQLSGRVRDGKLPAGLRPFLEQASPPLADVIRDINKFSNNVMAQQLFLSLGLYPAPGLEPGVAAARRSPALRNSASAVPPSSTFEVSRELLRTWWKQRWPDAEPPIMENGSGLSRLERISAQALGQMLRSAYLSPVMPELLSSLPVAGVDGTLRRSKASTARGSAHLKTGSLRDVAGVAGFVLGASGKRYVLVAIANHPTLAHTARPVFDALLEWTVKDQ
jgi:serine-type D-Ala-D-Ala carboxypeptidase/endopeptidase (penicillin-binding protein 4)